MVEINNNDPNSKDNSDIKPTENKTERYQIDKKELTFPIEGMKNARIVREQELSQQPDISDGKLNDNLINKDAEQAKFEAEQEEKRKEKERLDRLAFEDQGLKFIHLPDDPAYTPITVELIKLNDLPDNDLKVNTRIMMNIALSDYVIFRRIDDNDRLENVKIYFRRIKTNEFQEYVDLQTEVDDLVKRVGIVEMQYPPTLELQDQLYSYQKKLLAVARKRVRKGFDIFFKWKNQAERDSVFENADNNDITFNVDSGFVRLTKSPFLRRKSFPSS